MHLNRHKFTWCREPHSFHLHLLLQPVLEWPPNSLVGVRGSLGAEQGMQRRQLLCRKFRIIRRKSTYFVMIGFVSCCESVWIKYTSTSSSSAWLMTCDILTFLPEDAGVTAADAGGPVVGGTGPAGAFGHKCICMSLQRPQLVGVELARGEPVRWQVQDQVSAMLESLCWHCQAAKCQLSLAAQPREAPWEQKGFPEHFGHHLCSLPNRPIEPLDPNWWVKLELSHRGPLIYTQWPDCRVISRAGQMLVACQQHEMVMMTEHQFTSTASKRNGRANERTDWWGPRQDQLGRHATVEKKVCSLPLSFLSQNGRRLANLLPPNTR